MANPNNSGDRDERRKLLRLFDRLDFCSSQVHA